MANRFHLTENGPKTCTASVRNCPIGGAHFEDKEAAELAYELKADKKFSPLGALKKKSDPYTSHIARAEKRIRSLEADMKTRDARQKNGTLYHELRTAGVTDEELESRFTEETELRQSAISYLTNPDSDVKVIGLTYGGDYKAEEEWGMAHISKSLANGDYGPDDVMFYTKGGTTVLAIRGERNYGWSSNPETNESVKRAEEEAVDRYKRYTPKELRDLKWSLRTKSYAELRAELKGKVSPLPKSKDDAMAAVIKLRSNGEYRTPAMGQFQRGDALVIVTKDPVEAKLMQKLKESHDSGSLRVGSASNPFGRASMFFDDRDITRSAKSDLIRDEEARKAATAYVAETRSELDKNGSTFAVSPEVDKDLADVRESTYFLNYSPRNQKQIFGRFNKEQLDRIAAGDFSDVPSK